jgi:hypothetical protein
VLMWQVRLTHHVERSLRRALGPGGLVRMP